MEAEQLLQARRTLLLPEEYNQETRCQSARQIWQNNTSQGKDSKRNRGRARERERETGI